MTEPSRHVGTQRTDDDDGEQQWPTLIGCERYESQWCELQSGREAAPLADPARIGHDLEKQESKSAAKSQPQSRDKSRPLHIPRGASHEQTDAHEVDRPARDVEQANPAQREGIPQGARTSSMAASNEPG